MGTVHATQLPTIVQSQTYRKQVVVVVAFAALAGSIIGVKYRTIFDCKLYPAHRHQPLSDIVWSPVLVIGAVAFYNIKHLSIAVAIKRAAGLTGSYVLAFLVANKVIKFLLKNKV